MVDRVARALTLLYVSDLRELQNDINDILVSAQAFTANPCVLLPSFVLGVVSCRVVLVGASSSLLDASGCMHVCMHVTDSDCPTPLTITGRPTRRSARLGGK